MRYVLPDDPSPTCTAPARRRRHRSEAANGARARFLFSCSQCGGKRTYSDRKTARRAARINHPDDRLAAYECPHREGLWHIGHTNPWLRDQHRRSA